MQFQDDRANLLPEIIKFTEAIKFLKISRAKADRLVNGSHTDFPRPFKIGSERFFRVADLRAWIEFKANGSQLLADCRRRADVREVIRPSPDDWTVEDDAFF